MSHNRKTLAWAKDICDKIIDVYAEFGVEIDIKHKHITTIEGGKKFVCRVKPGAGVKIRAIMGLKADVQLHMKLPVFDIIQQGIHLLIVIAGEEYAPKGLLEGLLDSEAEMCQKTLPYFMGYDIWGNPLIEDVCDFPNLILAGPSQAGKTVALSGLISSISLNRSVQDVSFYIIDTGSCQDENGLYAFKNFPHLGHSIFDDEIEGARFILWLEKERKERKKSNKGAKNSSHRIVVIIDDAPDFIHGIYDKKLAKMVREIISNLLRSGRHQNIHIILSTQDPKKSTLDIDWDCVKPRLSFGFTQSYSSRAIIGKSGAQNLDGIGSALFTPPTSSKPVYFQTAFISPQGIQEVGAVLNKEYRHTYKFELTNEMMPSLSENDGIICEDQMPDTQEQRNREMCDVILWALGRDTVAAMQIKKRFEMGNRANDVLEKLTQLGIISGKNANRSRDVIPRCVEDVPTEVMRFLTDNGVSLRTIENAVREKPTPNLNYSDSEGVYGTTAPKGRKKLHRYLALKNGKAATDSSRRTLEDILYNVPH